MCSTCSSRARASRRAPRAASRGPPSSRSASATPRAAPFRRRTRERWPVEHLASAWRATLGGNLAGRARAGKRAGAPLRSAMSRTE
eukprot:8277811-Pyramimonas_sp.AAC.1